MTRAKSQRRELLERRISHAEWIVRRDVEEEKKRHRELLMVGERKKRWVHALARLKDELDTLEVTEEIEALALREQGKMDSSE